MNPPLVFLLSMLAAGSLHAMEETSELWSAWQHHHALDSQWQASSDIQLRSQDGGGPWRQLILRPSATRVLGGGLSASMGYAYVENRSITGLQSSEHRPWQQLQAQQKLGSGQFSQRLRLEQRMLESAQGDFTSDRARIQLRYQKNLGNEERYMAVHNETFMHLSERDRLNGQSFDQNRFGILTGWRLSPTLAVELGYTHVLAGLRDTDRTTHVLNITLVTRRSPSK